MTSASAPKTAEPDEQALQTIRAYHQRTKHRFEAYAPGPETLDWDEQPQPFRHFVGAPEFPLPPLKNIAQQTEFSVLLRRQLHATTESSAPLGLEALSMLLQLSLGITAWKSWGPDRWAVRANPSSGNLHPIEASLLLRGIPGLVDGLYRYCPDTHTLERRADFASSTGPVQLFVALSSITWREAWKYGERAFRYCQLDTGHAVGALCYAADLLGWPLTEQRRVGTATLGGWLGLDRSEDFAGGRHPYTEAEEAEILLSLTDAPDLEWLRLACGTARWHGKASVIDAHPMYRWPVIDEVARASRLPDDLAEQAVAATTLPDLTNMPDVVAEELILRRRSAWTARHWHRLPFRRPAP